jgi:hypothetical protein
MQAPAACREPVGGWAAHHVLGEALRQAQAVAVLEKDAQSERVAVAVATGKALVRLQPSRQAQRALSVIAGAQQEPCDAMPQTRLKYVNVYHIEQGEEAVVIAQVAELLPLVGCGVDTCWVVRACMQQHG